MDLGVFGGGGGGARRADAGLFGSCTSGSFLLLFGYHVVENAWTMYKALYWREKRRAFYLVLFCFSHLGLNRKVARRHDVKKKTKKKMRSGATH
jgi:hypothetical protein